MARGYQAKGDTGQSALKFIDFYDPATNTPALINGSGDAGSFYIAREAGTSSVVGAVVKNQIIALSSNLIWQAGAVASTTAEIVVADDYIIVNGQVVQPGQTLTEAIGILQGQVNTLKTGKANKVATPTAGNILTTDSTGQPVDGGKSLASLLTEVDDNTDDVAALQAQATAQAAAIATKQSKVTGATAGDLAELDSAGQTVDSGIAKSSVTTQGNAFNSANQLTKTDSTGKLPSAVIPSISVTSTSTVNLITDMLAQNPVGIAGGHVTFVRAETDTTKNGAYMFGSGGDVTVLADWFKLTDGVGINTVNGKSGSSVVLDNVDIGLGNVQNLDQRNASNLTSGTVADARLSAAVTKQGNAFNGADQLTKTDSAGKLPSSVIPSISVTSTSTVDLVADMLAQNPADIEGGHVTFVRAETDTAKNGAYMFGDGGDVTVLADWYKLSDGVGINTVNGKSGSSVVLDKTDVGLGNVQNLDQRNADNLTSGTVADARLSATVTKQGNTFNGADQLTKTDASGKLPSSVIPTPANIPNSATTATSANDADKIVVRDADRNFAANVVTADLNGNANTATAAVRTLTKNAHGFTNADKGRPLANVNGNIQFAKADLATTAGSMLLYSVIDVNKFQVIVGGIITISDWTAAASTVSLTPGATYYISDTVLGKLTTTAPTSNKNAIVQALTTTDAIVAFSAALNQQSSGSSSSATTIIPRFSKQLKGTAALGYIFIYGAELYSVGRGNDVSGIFGLYTHSYTPMLMQIDNTGAPIEGWSEIWYTYENALALTTAGRVFEVGSRINSRILKEITFPAGVVISKICATGNRHGSFPQVSYFVIDTNGKVYAWGDNSWGQLGVGNWSGQANPVKINALNAFSIVDISASGSRGQHVCALASNGQLFTWGYGDGVGQLGNNVNYTSVNTPYLVPGFSNVVKILAMGGHDGTRWINYTRVLRTDGTSWATGNNPWGALGIGNTTSVSVFTREVTNKTNIVDIGGLDGYGGLNYIVDSDGFIYFAGRNNDLCVGDGSGQGAAITSFTLTPQLMSAGFQGKMVQGSSSVKPKVVLAGTMTDGWNTMAIIDNSGTLWLCGLNNQGQCATGDFTSCISTWRNPIGLPAGKKVVDVIATGWPGSGMGFIVILEDGTMMGCGQSDYGAQGTSINPGSAYPAFNYVIGFAPYNKK